MLFRSQCPTGHFLYHMEIKSNDDLLAYLIDRANSTDPNVAKQWFGRLQQRITGIQLAHAIAANHADKMTPDQVVDYVNNLQNTIFKKIVIG